ncbi:hypothetical protein AAY473_028164 [Plecturocebus cupreus]
MCNRLLENGWRRASSIRVSSLAPVFIPAFSDNSTLPSSWSLKVTSPEWPSLIPQSKSGLQSLGAVLEIKPEASMDGENASLLTLCIRGLEDSMHLPKERISNTYQGPEAKNEGPEVKIHIQTLMLPFISCVTLGKAEEGERSSGGVLKDRQQGCPQSGSAGPIPTRRTAIGSAEERASTAEPGKAQLCGEEASAKGKLRNRENFITNKPDVHSETQSKSQQLERQQVDKSTKMGRNQCKNSENTRNQNASPPTGDHTSSSAREQGLTEDECDELTESGFRRWIIRNFCELKEHVLI